MNEEDIRDQQIEQYVHGRMSSEERNGFEQLLKADEALRVQVQDEMKLMSLYNKDLIAFNKKIDTALSDYSTIVSTSTNENISTQTETSLKVKPSRVVRIWKVWAAVASVVLLIGLIWFFNRPIDVQQLALMYAPDAYFTKDGLPVTRSSADSLDQLFLSRNYRGYILIAEKQSKNSISEPEKFQISKNIALCHIMTNEPDEAIRILKSFDSEHQSDCWLGYILSLAYLQKEEMENATLLLTVVKDQNCFRASDSANKILNRL